MIKYSDFGVSRFVDLSQKISTLTPAMGTFHWMAPEVLLRAKYNSQADIFSLGITYWELVNRFITREYSYPQPPSLDLIKTDRYIPPSVPEDFDVDIRTIVSGCLKKNPEERLSPSTILEILNQTKLNNVQKRASGYFTSLLTRSDSNLGETTHTAPQTLYPNMIPQQNEEKKNETKTEDLISPFATL